MNDRELRQALRELPRDGASEGFERRVLEKIEALNRDDPARPPRWSTTPARRWAAVAATLTLSVALALVLARYYSQPRPETRPEMGSSAPQATAAGPAPTSNPAAAQAPAPMRGAGRPSEATLRDLRAERADLAAELAELKRLVASGPGGGAADGTGAGTGDPVLYLGGDDRVELVLDLGRLADESAGRAVPTTFRDGGS